MQLQSEKHFQRKAGTAARRCVSDYNPPVGLKLGAAHRPIRAPENVVVRVSLTSPPSSSRNNPTENTTHHECTSFCQRIISVDQSLTLLANIHTFI